VLEWKHTSEPRTGGDVSKLAEKNINPEEFAPHGRGWFPQIFVSTLHKNNGA
jgi:hypothetical protein